MSVEWLVELGWKSLLLAALTLALLALAKGRSAAEKSLLGDAGLLSLLFLPLTVAWLPRVELAAPRALGSAIGSFAPAPIAATVGALPAAASAAEPAAAFDWNALFVGLYVVPAFALMTGLFFGLLRLRQLYGRARVLEDGRWLTALAAAQNRIGVKHGTALLISDEVNSPISWGVIRPVIVIDPAARAQSSRAEAIIAHELAHVHRLDWLKLIVGRLATVLFWFNPLVWVLARRCHQLREEAADDAVLRTRVATSDYADLLLTAVRHANARPLLAANGVAPSKSSIAQRVAHVLDASKPRRPARLQWTAAAVGLALLANGALAASVPVLERSWGTDSSAGDLAAADLAAIPNAHSRALARAMQARDESARRVDGDRNSYDALEQALVSAVQMGDIQAMNQLIAQGVSVDASVDGDGSPLIVAARQGRRDLVEALLARGADIDMGVEGDGNPLIAAAAAGNVGIVQHLLDRGANIEAVVPGDENALMQASRRGHEAVVRLLIARGANADSRVGHRTPLVMAAKGGHANIAALLRGAGAPQ